MSQFFPYKPRKFQQDIMDSVEETLRNGRHIIFESCTGSGKTVSVLAPALEYAVGNGKKILYLNRTNAQQRQVIIEFRKIIDGLKSNDPFKNAVQPHTAILRHEKSVGVKKKKDDELDDDQKMTKYKPIYCVALQGRQNMCLLKDEDEKLANGNAEELSKICRDMKKKTIEQVKNGDGSKGGGICRFYAGNCACEIEEIETWFRGNLPFAEEFKTYCKEKELCVHELNKELVANASLVVAPYIYFFDNFLRLSLLDWLQCSFDDIIVIVDEAHNLPEYARSLRSSELSQVAIKVAISEAFSYDDPVLINDVKCSEFCKELLRIHTEIVKNYVKDEDGFIPPDEFESELMSSFSLTSRKLEMVAENLIVIGETIRERRRLNGELPRSYLYALGSFLFFWLKLDTDKFVKLVIGGTNPKLEGYCLDPSLAADILNAVHGSIHMSGTLRPLEEYRDSLGLSKKSDLRLFSSPFPANHLSIFYVKDVTTKYELLMKNIPKLHKTIVDIINCTTRNTAFFFPSFELMKRFADIKPKHRTIFIEDQEMEQSELLDGLIKFKESSRGENGSVLFAVTGGRLSEGLDFPNKELEVVIVVGVPYPKPTARQTVLQLFYDMKFNKGWEYTVKAPTARKLLQSIGRMIRSEKDRGVAIILDSRAVHFVDFIHKLKSTDNPVDSITGFKFC